MPLSVIEDRVPLGDGSIAEAVVRFEDDLIGGGGSTRAHAETFRAVLDAMSRPGVIVPLDSMDSPNPAPAPLNRAAAAICASLAAFETPLWTDAEIAASGEAMNYLRFQCGCPVTLAPVDARTGLISNPQAMTSFERFNPGSEERPELSTTLIVQVNFLCDTDGVCLSGPGIKGGQELSAGGLPPAFWHAAHANAALAPRGVDLILCADAQIACLPRTTKVRI